MAVASPFAPRPLFVKVCCIKSRDEARLAIAAGASALGLVSAMPSGPGPIGEALIADIAAVGPFGVDVCSGVRTDGAKLDAFMAAAHPPAGRSGGYSGSSKT